MKNYIPILCAALIAVLASCSSDSLPTTNHSDLRQVTIDEYPGDSCNGTGNQPLCHLRMGR